MKRNMVKVAMMVIAMAIASVNMTQLSFAGESVDSGNEFQIEDDVDLPEPSTEPETEAPTEPETEPETEAPTEPETQPETVAPTEPETVAPESEAPSHSEPEHEKRFSGDSHGTGISALYIISTEDKEEVEVVKDEPETVPETIAETVVEAEAPMVTAVPKTADTTNMPLIFAIAAIFSVIAFGGIIAVNKKR